MVLGSGPLSLIWRISPGTRAPHQVMLSDRFDEGLMLLKILMGWDLIDMTYMPLNTNPDGTNTGRLGTPKNNSKGITGGGKRPHFDELPQEVRHADTPSLRGYREKYWRQY